MKNTFKKTLTAAAFAMLVALPFGAQAADTNNNITTAAKGSVKEILNDIRSMPKGFDGELIKTTIVLPFGNQDTNVAGCVVCYAGMCFHTC